MVADIFEDFEPFFSYAPDLSQQYTIKWWNNLEPYKHRNFLSSSLHKKWTRL